MFNGHGLLFCPGRPPRILAFCTFHNMPPAANEEKEDVR
jgi:hypothetical protein